MNPDCPKCRGEGWVCEAHVFFPFQHAGCPGPGIPCECNPAAENPPGFEVTCETEAVPRLVPGSDS